MTAEKVESQNYRQLDAIVSKTDYAEFPAIAAIKENIDNAQFSDAATKGRFENAVSQKIDSLYTDFQSLQDRNKFATDLERILMVVQQGVKKYSESGLLKSEKIGGGEVGDWIEKLDAALKSVVKTMQAPEEAVAQQDAAAKKRASELQEHTDKGLLAITGRNTEEALKTQLDKN